METPYFCSKFNDLLTLTSNHLFKEFFYLIHFIWIIVPSHETIMLFSRVKCWKGGGINPTQLIKMSQRGVLTHPARWNQIMKPRKGQGVGYICLEGGGVAIFHITSCGEKERGRREREKDMASIYNLIILMKGGKERIKIWRCWDFSFHFT